MRRRLLEVLTLLVAVLALTPPAAARDEKGPLVLAAASLQEAMTAAADRWSAKGHPRPVVSFAGTPALARQAEAGAPADLFVSADEAWMDYLVQRHLIRPRTRADVARNALVLIAPASSRTRLTVARGFPLARALGGGKLAMADPDSVPAGRYGKEALTRLGVWPGIADQVVRAENVRAALTFVRRGAAPLGVVYATDALAERGVRVVGRFPQASHAPIRYPLAVLRQSRHRDAEGFRRFLLSAEGRALFRRFGFAAG
jgi:molybdate transport system substrate-binding protein